MALKDADIQTIKDSVPDRFRPADSGGLLSSVFSADLRSKSAALKGSERDKHNQEIAFVAGGADASAPNFILSGSAQILHDTALEKVAQTKSEKNDLDFALAQSREQLRRVLDALDAELAAIDARLEEIRLRRIEIGNALDATQDVEDLITSGELDPNNPAQAALCRRAGIDPEELRGKDKENQLDLIMRRRGELTSEDGTLETEWNEKMKRRGVVVTERNDVVAALDGIDAAKTDEEKMQAELRAQRLLDEHHVSGVSLTQGNVVSSSPPAVESVNAFLDKTDELDWDDKPASPQAVPAQLPKP